MIQAGIEVCNRTTLMDAPDSTLMRSWVPISFRKAGHKSIHFLFTKYFDVNITMITQNRPRPHPSTSFPIHHSQLPCQSKACSEVGCLTTMTLCGMYGFGVVGGIEIDRGNASRPLCRFVRHRCHITGPAIEPGSPLWSMLYCIRVR
jgi:hypothetical protein